MKLFLVIVVLSLTSAAAVSVIHAAGTVISKQVIVGVK